MIPWKDLLDLIRPHYFVSGRRGRQPYALELMLRIHLLQITYNLSDPQMEDCLHENFTVLKFVGLSMADRTPDETTILQFRHILEEHDLGPQIIQTVNAKINAAGLHLVKGELLMHLSSRLQPQPKIRPEPVILRCPQERRAAPGTLA